jgi:hypothetical protein
MVNVLNDICKSSAHPESGGFLHTLTNPAEKFFKSNLKDNETLWGFLF